MRKINFNTFIILLLFYYTGISQTNHNNNYIIHKDSILASVLKEKAWVKKAWALFNDKKAENAYKLATKLRKTLKTNYGIGDMNLLLSDYFKNRTLIDSSSYYAKQALRYISLNNDSLESRRRSLVYNVLGINYKNRGLYEESKKWHIKGIEEAERYNENELYYTHTHGLAVAYNKTKDLNNALQLFKKCLEYKKDKQIISASYINIGIIYSELQNYDLAKKYFEKGLELSEENNNHRERAVITLNLAVNSQEQNKPEEAIKLYSEVITISDKHNLDYLGLMAKTNIGSVYIDLQKYKDAEAVYSSALPNAKKLGVLSMQLNIFENLKQTAIEQNDYKKAFNFISNYFNIKDSIIQLQKNKEIKELEVRYKTIQKDKEIKLLLAENSNRKLKLVNQQESIKNLNLKQEIERKKIRNRVLAFQNAAEKKSSEINFLKKEQELQEVKAARQKSITNTITYSLLVILIPIIGLVINYYQKLITQSKLNEKQREFNKQKIQTLLKEQELEVIKATMKGQDKERKRIASELHDSIGGNLAAIKLQLSNTEIDNLRSLKKVNNQIDDTYQLVRNISHTLIPKKFVNNNFCNLLEEYLNNIGNTSKILTSFSAHTPKQLNIINAELRVEIFKIIQELITNTIKHSQANAIDLQINFMDDIINILFEDNGTGFNQDITKDGLGFGSIKNRLKKISGSLDIDSRKGRGTIINIEITKIKNLIYNEV